MKFKLQTILESTVLLEGRKDGAIKKYGEEYAELINLLSDSDPSGNNKYLDWMVKTSLGQNQDDQIPTADKVVQVVQDFHKQLTRIKNKDINSYKTLIDLENAVNEAKAKEEEKKIAKQAKKVFEDDTAVIYAPFTTAASCKYGAGSKWCIAGKDHQGNLNNHFDSYSRHSNFYFFINKTMSRESNPEDYKYALQWRFDGQGRDLTWWDAQDRSHTNPPSWVTPEMMDAVEKFNPVHMKIKLGTQLKAFIQNPNVNDYGKFGDMMTPEQKTDIINKIIKQGNLNSQTFVTLSPDLTDKQKNDFITNYVKGVVNTSDFKNMRDNLNTEQQYTLIKHNPQILNNFGLMSDFDEMFTDEQKYQLTKKMDTSLVNNTDSKVLLRKWGMTEEERKAHGQKSFYVFLSSEDEYIEKFVKVDPLDPESYKAINMMKLRRQVEPDISMFGIKTKSGLLDEYVGSTTEEIPNDIIDLLKKESTKIS